MVNLSILQLALEISACAASAKVQGAVKEERYMSRQHVGLNLCLRIEEQQRTARFVPKNALDMFLRTRLICS